VSSAGGHEPMDVAGRPVLAAAIGLVVVLLLVAGGQLMLLRHYAERGRDATLAETPAEPRTPPEPRLLVDPRSALLELRAEEDALLDGYAWVNREAGIVRIPVDRAIEILAGSAGKAPAR
jgi:hypothetical protein